MVNAYLPPVAPYPEGFAFGGIIWNNHYVDGRLDMSTKAGAVRKLDVVVGLDTHIAGIGQITQFPNVTMFPDQMPLMWLRGTDLQRHPISIPATPMLGIAPVYRIQCVQIFANTTVHFVIASVAMNPIMNGKVPQQMFAPRRNPKKIRLNGTYQTEQGVKRKIDYTFDFPDVAPKQ